MSDLPQHIHIVEEGPREGFQIEPGPIPTIDKIALIDALSLTGLRHIQAASFVSAKIVPSWADAEAVIAGFTPRPEVEVTALYFSKTGLARVLAFRDRLAITGSISLAASDTFSRRNLNRDRAAQVEAMRQHVVAHAEAGVPVTRLSIQAAFGCNFEGDIAPTRVMETVADGLHLAAETGVTLRELSLADTMGWATPARIEQLVGAVRMRWPDLRLSLHLHDTRGLGIANAHSGLQLGVACFDSTVGGLGGCPFAGHPGAPGNIASEELVLLCEEMGIETGVDLDALIEAGRLAERIVGHPLPSAVLRGGSLRRFRALAS